MIGGIITLLGEVLKLVNEEMARKYIDKRNALQRAWDSESSKPLEKIDMANLDSIKLELERMISSINLDLQGQKK